jgi:hypothetical protein
MPELMRCQGVFVCVCDCPFACEIACALACELRARRGIPHPRGDRRLADLPTYLRSIEVGS